MKRRFYRFLIPAFSFLLCKEKPNLESLRAWLYGVVTLGTAHSFGLSAAAADFTDANWSSIGGVSGANAGVYAAVVDGSGNLFIGGRFTMVGDTFATNIARWDGSNWSALGSGINGDYVRALAVSGASLYAGGSFTNAGGRAVNNIARWDGSSWSALGSGINVYSVEALAVSGSNLYAGGSFTNLGGAPVANIARWDGSSWSALGELHGYGLHALAVSGSNLYAGGDFSIGTIADATSIARWDGSNWSSLRLGGTVFTLAASTSDLYAGGVFYQATTNGNVANSIAKWNGSNWSALGSGMYGSQIRALAVSGSAVYAGGCCFTNAGGIAATNIAKWDGSSWSALGSGCNDVVGALVESSSDLYVGGSFTLAGGKLSPYLARAYLPPLPNLSIRRSGKDVAVFWPSTGTAGFALEQADILAPSTTWVSNTASVTGDGTNKSVTIPATNGAQYLRLRRP